MCYVGVGVCMHMYNVRSRTQVQVWESLTVLFALALCHVVSPGSNLNTQSILNRGGKEGKEENKEPSRFSPLRFGTILVM